MQKINWRKKGNKMNIYYVDGLVGSAAGYDANNIEGYSGSLDIGALQSSYFPAIIKLLNM
jgi:hypothetical protein